MPAEVALARLELARVIAVGEPAVAVAELETAHDTFERIGARRPTDEAAACAARRG